MNQNRLRVRLKQALEEDLWNVINKRKLIKIDFFSAVQEELLNGRKLNLMEVAFLAKELATEYDETLAFFYDGLSKNNYVDILELIKATNKRLYYNINSTINTISYLKLKYDGKLKNRVRVSHGKS